MRDASNISISELIIHILDPQGQGLVLSSAAVPLEGNETLLEYFANHVRASLKDSGIKAARFRDIHPERTSGVCRDILRGETSLAEGSQRLAQELYAILEHDRRITPGDLAVCLFRADNYPYTQFMGVMKVDPAQIFRHVILEDENGESYISLETMSEAFTSERLQKCAFVQPLEPRHPEYDMLLLDKQQRLAKNGHSSDDQETPVSLGEAPLSSGNGTIARFFSETFLDTEEAIDSRKLTELVYRGLVSAENRVREQLTQEESETLDEGIRQAVNSRRLDLDAWLESLPLTAGIKQEIDQAVSPRLPVREVSIDRGFSQQLMRKIKYRGEGGLRLEVPSEVYNVLVVSEERITDDPNRPPYYRIVIETEEWNRAA
jgi:hypothetical protein